MIGKLIPSEKLDANLIPDEIDRFFTKKGDFELTSADQFKRKQKDSRYETTLASEPKNNHMISS